LVLQDTITLTKATLTLLYIRDLTDYEHVAVLFRVC